MSYLDACWCVTSITSTNVTNNSKDIQTWDGTNCRIHEKECINLNPERAVKRAAVVTPLYHAKDVNNWIAEIIKVFAGINMEYIFQQAFLLKGKEIIEDDVVYCKATDSQFNEIFKETISPKLRSVVNESKNSIITLCTILDELEIITTEHEFHMKVDQLVYTPSDAKSFFGELINLQRYVEITEIKVDQHQSLDTMIDRLDLPIFLKTNWMNMNPSTKTVAKLITYIRIIHQSQLKADKKNIFINIGKKLDENENNKLGKGIDDIKNNNNNSYNYNYKKKNLKNVICYVCGKKGHVAYYCSDRKDKLNSNKKM